MSRVGRRFRTLPIRARLSMLVAAAVAFAVAAVSVTCWFIVQGKLYDQVDNQLDSAVFRLNEGQVTALLAACPKNVTEQTDAMRPRDYFVQVVKADGTVCVFTDSVGVMKATARDKSMATDPDLSLRIFHNSTDNVGKDVRVRTTPVVLGFGPNVEIYPDVALMVGVSLKETQKTLNELALVLLLVSGIGVVGAGAAGLAVARAGLRPVDKLTEAVEHVARTEDLSIRIPVEQESDDEIARLSRSFNSMTSSLANSRELQQQLIADAGHELRTPLTSLRTNIELLTRSEETGRPIPEADRKALLASVKAQMTELAALIGDLQELSRSEGQRGERVQVVALEDTVESALRRARLRGPELTITADIQPWFVRGNRRRWSGRWSTSWTTR